MLFGPTFVKTVRPVLSVLSVCPVRNVGVLWPNGRIKMKLGVRVGLGPDHIVLGGDPAAPTLKGHSPPNSGPYLLWPNGWMHQDATWYGVGLGPGHIVLDGEPAPPLPKKGHSPNFPGWIKMPLSTKVGLGRATLC